MNKESRQFIWGLILVPLCTYGTIYFGLDLRDHITEGTTIKQLAFDLSGFALELFGAISGGHYIVKNI